jgi:hypothetical protein
LDTRRAAAPVSSRQTALKLGPLPAATPHRGSAVLNRRSIRSRGRPRRRPRRSTDRKGAHDRRRQPNDCPRCGHGHCQQRKHTQHAGRDRATDHNLGSKRRALANREYGFEMPATSTIPDVGALSATSRRQRCAQ